MSSTAGGAGSHGPGAAILKSWQQQGQENTHGRVSRAATGSKNRSDDKAAPDYSDAFCVRALCRSAAPARVHPFRRRIRAPRRCRAHPLPPHG